jgi:hypothetical protein
MTIGVPKPAKRTESEQVVERLTKAWARRDRWRAKAIANAKGKPRTKVKARNEKRIARKAKAYRTVIASDFHKALRYAAYQRSGGLCECEQCVGHRRAKQPFPGLVWWADAEIALAYTEIPCWFVQGGGEPFRRFRSTEGELHHAGKKGRAPYSLFGEENPAELELVQWVHTSCHQRLEREHSTRRRFLTGK